MSERKTIRVVAVSPGDVRRERDALTTTIDELNRGIADELGLRLSLWRWETDARPGLHLEGPQGVIDELMDIEDADLVIGIFWKRFGTPTRAAGSGTEHELNRARAAWSRQQSPEVMLYFCERRSKTAGAAEARQALRVHEFRDALPDTHLWWAYTLVTEFQQLVREHITTYIRELPRDDPAAREGSGAPAADAPGRAGGEPVGRRRVRFNVPLALSYFTGREDELDAIDETLGVAGKLVVSQAITGLGGIGKTQLAARYLHDHERDYDIVAWIRAQDGGTGDLAALARDLVHHPANTPAPELAQQALRCLETCTERWLLVLDNLETPDQLPGCCPRSGNGRVLITTRHRAMSQHAPLLTLGVFDAGTATDTLQRITDRAGDRDAARRLALALGCLPLAIAHAGAYCAAGTSYTDYEDLLENLPAGELFDRSPEAFYEQTIASTWHASITAATASAPLAGDVLAVAAHLAPDAIPRTLLHTLIDPNKPAQRKRLSDAIGALTRLSLLTPIDGEQIAMHRLLQKVVRDQLPAEQHRSGAEHALSGVHDAFQAAGDPTLPAAWPACERIFAHALALTGTLPDPVDRDDRLTALLNQACGYALFAGGGQRAIRIATAAAGRAERLLGPEHPDTLQSRNNLAVSYRTAGRTGDAITLHERVLADRERILGPEHPNTLTSRNNLAVSYRTAGRTGDAITLHERVLADRERILGPEHPNTLQSRSNLAESYRTAGRTSDAITLHERVLADRERILGPEHPNTLTSRNNLALSYHSAGRTGDAITLHERVLADRERILGPEHPDTLQARNNLAHAYHAAGRTAEAITLMTVAAADRERILGSGHPYTVGSRDTLAAWTGGGDGARDDPA